MVVSLAHNICARTYLLDITAADLKDIPGIDAHIFNTISASVCTFLFFKLSGTWYESFIVSFAIMGGSGESMAAIFNSSSSRKSVFNPDSANFVLYWLFILLVAILYFSSGD